MRKIFLFSFLGLLCSLSGSCQEFNELVNQSLSYFKQNEFRKFEETYPKLYLEYLKTNIPSYQEAINAANSGNIELAFSNINELIDEDLFLDEIEHDEDFKVLHQKGAWSILLQKIKTIKSSYNEGLRSELKEVQNRDQGIRILYLHIENDSLKTAVHDYMKTIVDNDCSAKICPILDKYGWVGTDEIGSEANGTLFLAVQHVDDLKVQEKYLPMLKDAVKSGKAEGWQLAFLTDRILMNQGRKQIYGTQKIISKDPARSYIIPLEDPNNVDELRKEVGLPPLAKDLEEEGMHWDLEEYKKNLPTIEKMYRERYETLKNGEFKK
ncbi:DUF6624 domain-containing protein [Dysgonomonas sp. ZJ709]|uniref:DUF6624 domain-containing protein n=1 Tax=Dysgonomonas sp. ZJ709 TaxID=2709797 RepID=UPI0013EBA5B5|nr:DUF6624 domain-containing protein [Dysgonomonas sp. ZJ709]